MFAMCIDEMSAVGINQPWQRNSRKKEKWFQANLLVFQDLTFVVIAKSVLRDLWQMTLFTVKCVLFSSTHVVCSLLYKR